MSPGPGPDPDPDPDPGLDPGPRGAVVAAPGVRFRAARAADAGQVADVLLASRRAFLPWAPLAGDEACVRAWVRDVLLPATRVTLACTPGGEVVAFLSAQPARGRDEPSWIEQLYVAPGHVGRGLGGRLLRDALDRLPRPVHLYTFQANARARAFYERHGFVAAAFGDGRDNEEGCPDVRYELASPPRTPIALVPEPSRDHAPEAGPVRTASSGPRPR